MVNISGYRPVQKNAVMSSEKRRLPMAPRVTLKLHELKVNCVEISYKDYLSFERYLNLPPHGSPQMKSPCGFCGRK